MYHVPPLFITTDDLRVMGRGERRTTVLKSTDILTKTCLVNFSKVTENCLFGKNGHNMYPSTGLFFLFV